MAVSDIIDLVLRVLINVVDIGIIYYLCHNVMNRKPKLKLVELLLFIIYGVIGGIMFFYHGDVWIRLFAHIFIIMGLKTITKKPFNEVLIIYAFLFVIGGMTQGISFLFIHFTSFVGVYYYLFIQMVNVIFSVIIYKKIRLYKAFHYVSDKLFLKIVLIAALCFFWILLAWILLSRERIYENLFFLSIVFAMMSVAIYQVSDREKKLTMKRLAELHDTKKTLRAIYTELGSLDESNASKHMMQIIEVKYPNAVINHLEVGDINGNIEKFIKEQKEINDAILKTDITYIEQNPRVSLSLSLEMLATLLDNAIETGTRKPIEVYFFMAYEEIEICVSNESEHLFPDDFNNMFSKGYSTKGEQRGYGLPNLAKDVEKIDGDFEVQLSYHEEYKCNYLTMTIHVKTYNKKRLFKS